MAGPPNIRGVGAEFTAGELSSAYPNISLPILRTRIKQTRRVEDEITWATQTETRENADWFRSGAEVDVVQMMSYINYGCLGI
jgi:hypothetical protein